MPGSTTNAGGGNKTYSVAGSVIYGRCIISGRSIGLLVSKWKPCLAITHALVEVHIDFADVLVIRD